WARSGVRAECGRRGESAAERGRRSSRCSVLSIAATRTSRAASRRWVCSACHHRSAPTTAVARSRAASCQPSRGVVPRAASVGCWREEDWEHWVGCWRREFLSVRPFYCASLNP
ncbi:Os04g0538750, partial [Oryza sativa Japonica Group]